MQSSAGEIFTFGSYPHKWSYLEKYVCKKDNNKKWGSFSLIFILILMEVDFYWWMIIIGNALINQVSFNSHTFFTPQNPIFTSPIWTNYLVCVCVCDCFLLTYFYIRYWLPLAQSMQLFAHSLGLASFFTNQKLYSFGFFNWWINKIVFKFKCFYKYFLVRIRRHY